MRILLINHYAGSKNHGMEYRPYYFAREWVRQGHDVTIAASSFSHLRYREILVPGQYLSEKIDGIDYLWIKTPAYAGNGIGRVINILSFLFRLRSCLLKGKDRFDAVICSSTYPLDIIIARALARKNPIKIVYEVHDLWPLTLIEIGGMSKNHPFVLWLQWAENLAYRLSDYVVSMLPLAKVHMIQHGMAPEKFVYIPNGFNAEEWVESRDGLPAFHQEVIARYKEKGLFLVCYAGAHGEANALATLVQAADLLRDEPVAFILVGQGPERDNLIDQKNKIKLRNIEFLPAVDKLAIPKLLRQMDALYIGLRNQPLFRFGISPNKLMDYMMAGKPVIQAIDAGNDIVSEAGCGFSIPPENASAAAEAVLSLSKMKPEERLRLGQAGREYVHTHHDHKILANKFLALLTKT